MSTGAVSPVGSPQAQVPVASEHPIMPKELRSKVLNELKREAQKERRIKNFGRFLISFGTTAAVIGSVIAIAAALLSTPVGWAVGLGIAGLGITAGIVGGIILLVQHRHKPESLLQAIKNGIVTGFRSLTLSFWSSADASSLAGSDPQASSPATLLMLEIVLGMRPAKPHGELKFTSLRNKEKEWTYQFLEGGAHAVAFDVPLNKLQEPAQKKAYASFIAACDARKKDLISSTFKGNVYEDVVLPFVKQGQYDKACDLLGTLHQKESSYAVEIAALMLRAKQKRSLREYFEQKKDGVLVMLMQEIAKNPENPDPRLLLLYNQLSKLG